MVTDTKARPVLLLSQPTQAQGIVLKLVQCEGYSAKHPPQGEAVCCRPALWPHTRGAGGQSEPPPPGSASLQDRAHAW